MEWNLKKVQGLIDEMVEEDLNLDYKAGDALQRNDKHTNEISKDISAFANSDGGVIIYGIQEDKQHKHLPGVISAIDRKIISKEWLEHIIQSTIRPRIENVVIYPIPIDENSDLVLYVVEIPQSSTAHQANDKKYYKRYNFNSEPMYDYEIRDILNRTKFPIIDLEFQITKTTYELKSDLPIPPSFSGGRLIFPEKEFRTDYTISIYAQNNGKVLANYINAYVFIPTILLEKGQSSNESITQIFMDNTIRDIVDMQVSYPGRSIPKYGPSRYDPILPTRKMKIERVEINGNFLNSDDLIQWIVFSDNSEPRKGEIQFKDIKVIEK